MRRIIYLVLFIVLIALLVRTYLHSLFFTNPSRVNVVFYGQKTALYSLDNAGDTDYIINYYPDLKILIPGGYGYYRVGALGKLISLETKPAILSRAFSSATSSFVSYYFYSSQSSVYYGEGGTDEVTLPNINSILFSAGNANFLDRIYLALKFSFTEKSNFTSLSDYTTIAVNGESSLDELNFAEKYRGYFYQKIYRDENKTVQITYTNKYSGAAVVNRILLGNGIRTVDISQTSNQFDKCEIVEEQSKFSETAKQLAAFLGCDLIRGKTTTSDIIVILGPLENTWEGIESN